MSSQLKCRYHLSLRIIPAREREMLAPKSGIYISSLDGCICSYNYTATAAAPCRVIP